jgi:hypothetical protein
VCNLYPLVALLSLMARCPSGAAVGDRRGFFDGGESRPLRLASRSLLLEDGALVLGGIAVELLIT